MLVIILLCSSIVSWPALHGFYVNKQRIKSEHTCELQVVNTKNKMSLTVVKV